MLKHTSPYGEVFVTAAEVALPYSVVEKLVAAAVSGTSDLSWLIDIAEYLPLVRERLSSGNCKVQTIQELAEVHAQERKWRSSESYRRHEYADRRADLFSQLVERDGNKCRECGATSDVTVDHIQPLSRGGSNDLANLQLLCRQCNSRKGAR